MRNNPNVITVVKSTPHATQPGKRWISLTDPSAVSYGLPDYTVEIATHQIIEKAPFVTKTGEMAVRLTVEPPIAMGGQTQSIITLNLANPNPNFSLNDDGTELTVMHTVNGRGLLEAISDQTLDTLDLDDPRTQVAWQSAGPGATNIIDSFEPLPTDDNGNFLINPNPISVAKTN